MFRKNLVIQTLFYSLLLQSCDSNHHESKNKETIPLPENQNTLDKILENTNINKVLTIKKFESDVPNISFVAKVSNEYVDKIIKIRNISGKNTEISTLYVVGHLDVFKLHSGHSQNECHSEMILDADKDCLITLSIQSKDDVKIESELAIISENFQDSLFIPLSVHGYVTPSPPRSDKIYENYSQNAILTRHEGLFQIEGIGGETQHHRKLQDLDYSEAGIAGIVSTFPVDRSRIITADRYIPAVLENSIDSQLPGRAIAIVEKNIYGSDNRLVLIPAGSRIIGHYQSSAKMGEARLDISWSRILRPDGTSLNIDFTAADPMGRAGISGDLDSRFFEKYGSSLLTSIIGAAGTWALGGKSALVANSSGVTQTFTSASQASNRLGNDLDQLAQKMIQDNIDLRPILMVPQGSRLTVILQDDIILRDPDRIESVSGVKSHSLSSKTDKIAQLVPSLTSFLLQQAKLNSDPTAIALLQTLNSTLAPSSTPSSSPSSINLTPSIQNKPPISVESPSLSTQNIPFPTLDPIPQMVINHQEDH
jgi:hypothetical protein